MKRAGMIFLGFCCLGLLTPSAWADSAAAVQACNQAREASDYAAAVTQAEIALKDGAGKRDAYLCLGRAQGELGNHAAALLALQAAEQLSSQPMERMVAITLLGNQYRAARDYAQAQACYERSLAIAREEKNTRFQLININQIGDSRSGAGDQAGALALYQQGLQLAANDNERADSYARIAAAHSALGHHDQAIEQQIKAVLLEERSGDLDHYAHANIELGRICLAAKAYGDAEKWLNKFVPVMVQNDSAYWEARARHLLGQVSAARGDAKSADEQYAQARALAGKIGDHQLLQEIGQPTPAM